MTYQGTAPIYAVCEQADFGPAYNGEDFVTLTFRVPKSTPAIPGIWELTPLRPGSFDWAETKEEPDANGELVKTEDAK